MNQLKILAEKLVADPTNEDSRRTFDEGLNSTTDVEYLRTLADEYAPHTDVSIPAYERLLALRPDDLKAIAALGFIFWLDGDDEQAWAKVQKAFEIDKNDVDAMLLEAALTRDAEKKAAIYRKVLEREPDNRIAQDNLTQLNTGR